MPLLMTYNTMITIIVIVIINNKNAFQLMMS